MEEKNGLQKIALRIEGITAPLIGGFFHIGILCIVFMMLLTVADVLLRFLFNSPILGSYEISECFMVVLVFSAVGYTEKIQNHVKVDTFYHRFPLRIQNVLDCITDLLGISVLFLISWTNVKMAYMKWSFGDITGALPIPIYPMHIVIAGGSMLFCIALMVHCLNAMAKVIKNES